MTDTITPTMPDRAPEAGAWALFLDFDGTLVDIVERPDAVQVDPSLPAVLARLRDRLGGALALVSGRPVATLDEFLAPYRGDAAGLHGLEHRIAGRLFPCRAEDHPRLRRGVEALHAELDARPGLLIEDKGCSVAVHWRMAPDHAAFARDTIAALAVDLGEAYRIQYGKAVAEILPATAGKGPVIEHFLTRPPYAGRRPIFVGDDLTDENGFEAVNRHGGVSVRVGGGETIAHHHVATPSSLRLLLSQWAEDGRIDFNP